MVSNKRTRSKSPEKRTREKRVLRNCTNDVSYVDEEEEYDMDITEEEEETDEDEFYDCMDEIEMNEENDDDHIDDDEVLADEEGTEIVLPKTTHKLKFQEEL